MRCITKNCKNHESDGLFVGLLCMSCHSFITEGKGRYSQIYRNTIEQESMRSASIIAKLQEENSHLLAAMGIARTALMLSKKPEPYTPPAQAQPDKQPPPVEPEVKAIDEEMV